MRRLSYALVSVLLVGGLAPAQAQAPGSPSAPPAASALGTDFHLEACPEGLWPEDLDVDCGYIRVPQDRDHPAQGRIKVRAAVIHSPSPDPDPNPILLLPGGPSAGAITDFSWLAYFRDTWDDEHDVVLVDTRGVGLSTPRLGCPEMDRAGVKQFYAGPSIGSRAPRIMTKALRACKRRLQKQGVDLTQYTTQQRIADLETLRRRLEFPQWNLMAVSADGVLGLSYLRAHPDSFRSVIVDSGMTPQMRGVVDYERGRSQELKGILAGCAANDACRAKYPHLRRSFMRMVRRLNEQPVTVSFPKFRPHPVRLRLDGAGLYVDALSEIFPGNLFAPENIHNLLSNMWDLTHGHLTRTYRRLFGRGPVTNDHYNDFVSLGATMSYECHDIINFLTRQDRRDAVRAIPAFAPRFLGRHFDLGDSISNERSPAGCRVWPVGRAPAAQHEPVRSKVPTLVLTGGMDNGVPRYITRQAMPGLKNSTYVSFPASGHQQLADFNVAYECARSIAEDFLDHPRQQPDTSCVADVPEFDYTPPPEKGRPGVEQSRGFGRWHLGTDRYDQMGW